MARHSKASAVTTTIGTRHIGEFRLRGRSTTLLACKLLVLGFLLYANILPRWIVMVHSSWRDCCDLSFGWPLTFRWETLVLDSGSSSWQRVTTELSVIAMSANAIVAVASVYGVAMVGNSVARVLTQKQYRTIDIVAIIFLIGCGLGYVTAEGSIAQIELVGRLEVAPIFLLPGYLRWTLRFAVACSALWAVVLVKDRVCHMNLWLLKDTTCRIVVRTQD